MPKILETFLFVESIDYKWTANQESALMAYIEIYSHDFQEQYLCLFIKFVFVSSLLYIF